MVASDCALCEAAAQDLHSLCVFVSGGPLVESACGPRPALVCRYCARSGRVGRRARADTRP
eukprot:6245828-Prymnesium_polylepis.2